MAGRGGRRRDFVTSSGGRFGGMTIRQRRRSDLTVRAFYLREG
jgi:hypothetical protein